MPKTKEDIAEETSKTDRLRPKNTTLQK